MMMMLMTTMICLVLWEIWIPLRMQTIKSHHVHCHQQCFDEVSDWYYHFLLMLTKRNSSTIQRSIQAEIGISAIQLQPMEMWVFRLLKDPIVYL